MGLHRDVRSAGSGFADFGPLNQQRTDILVRVSSLFR